MVRAARQATLADLPPAAQLLVSATLGRDEPTYHFQATADGYRVINPSNTWSADFSQAGMRLESSAAQWTLALRSIGYGEAQEPVSQVAPTASANRLEYRHGAFTEWYVNGPAGLEQGWTVSARPPSTIAQDGAGSRLTLTLNLDGKARLDASGNSIELLREDGALAFRYTGLLAFDAAGRELRTWFAYSRVPSRSGERGEVQIQVDDTGAQYPLTIDPYVLQATLTNSGGAANDWLGNRVAISSDGSTIVAGAPGVSSMTGAAYVFVRSGSSWATTSAPTATLTNSGGVAEDGLGNRVAISGDGSTIVAGATGVSGKRGAAYVFVRSGSSWVDMSTPTATLTNSGGAVNDYLGYSVAISSDGSTIVAGAFGVNESRGAAYVFAKGAGSWVTTSAPTATLTNSGGTANDGLGWSVAISGDGLTIVTGAAGVSIGKGAAYVFVRSGSSWMDMSTPTATLTDLGGAAGNGLGWSVVISSDGLIIVAGAYRVNGSRGAAYVFAKGAGEWVTTGTPTATLANAGGVGNDNLGYSVAISSDGSTIVAGAPGVSSSRGAAYVFIQPSSNADLSNLGLSSGTLNPAFASSTTSYTATVANSVTSITVTPSMSDANATIQVRVNGGTYTTVASGSASGALALNVGGNPIDVKVTAQDGTTTKTYTVMVTRAPSLLYLPLIKR
jgi:hypothetical protein